MEDSREAGPELAAQLRQWSNLGHWIIGGLLAVVGVLGGGWRYAWPGVLAFAGFVLPAGILSHGHADFGRA